MVGFIDDDKSLQGKKINRIPVHSFSVLTREFISKHSVNNILLAIKDIDIERKSRISD